MPDENTAPATTGTAESGYDVGKLEGVEKAAILLLSLTEEDAAQILKHLEPKQVQRLGQAMAQIDDMTQPKIQHHRLPKPRLCKTRFDLSPW